MTISCAFIDRLESPTRSLEMQASQEIFIQSRAGSIEANSLNDIKLRSISGSVSKTTKFRFSCLQTEFLSRFVLMPKTSSYRTLRQRNHQTTTKSQSQIILPCTKFIKCACVTTARSSWHLLTASVLVTMSTSVDSSLQLSNVTVSVKLMTRNIA